MVLKMSSVSSTRPESTTLFFSMIHHLYIVFCVYDPKLSLFKSLFIIIVGSYDVPSLSFVFVFFVSLVDKTDIFPLEQYLTT